MLNKIYQTFYELARQHKLIRSFRYNYVNVNEGSGEENFPELFLEDNIFINDFSLTGGTVNITINFDITMIPQAFDNEKTGLLTVEECQNVAIVITNTMIAKLKNDYQDTEDLKPISWSIQTLRDWYDNKAAGARCTLTASIKNPIYFCDIDEHFDENKTLDMESLLSPIPTNDLGGCVVFSDKKFPKITL